MKFQNFIHLLESESDDCDKIAEDIKNHLLEWYDFDTWEDFIQKQEIGDCQILCSGLNKIFPINSVFGEIKIDNDYIDEYGETQNQVTHHWLLCGESIIDISKGTLKDYIVWSDVNSVFVTEEEKGRYNPLGLKK